MQIDPHWRDVREYGALGDGKTNDAAAIQSAIDAVAAAGGGTVPVPPGEYHCGAIRLKSRVTLLLEAGATLYASTDPADYAAGAALLNASGETDVTVCGAGALHGRATGNLSRGEKNMPAFRNRLVHFVDCRGVRFSGVRLLYSDSWTLHVQRCDDVVIDGITIFNNVHRINSDGIDLNSCRNARVANCHIVAGDDCIVLKTTTGDPCENVVVTNCTLESGATAIKLGTESHADFRDVHVSNCVVRRSSGGIGLFVKDGALMERISFSDISITDREEESVPKSATPIFVDIERRHADSRLGAVRDLRFSGIQVHSRFPALIQGAPGAVIENVTLRDISLRVDRWEDFSQRTKRVGGRRTTSDERDTRFARLPAYLTFAYIRDLTLDNVRLAIDPEVYAKSPRAVVAVHAVEGRDLRHVRRTVDPEEKEAPLVLEGA